MAKGKSNRGNAHGTPSSLTSLLSPTKIYSPAIVTIPAPIQIAVSPQQVRTYLDRRLYRPDLQHPGAVQRKHARLVVDRFGDAVRSQVQRATPRLPHRVQFQTPNKIAVCVRRKQRREVLHALRLTRRVGKGGAKRRRNLWTGVHC